MTLTSNTISVPEYFNFTGYNMYYNWTDQWLFETGGNPVGPYY